MAFCPVCDWLTPAGWFLCASRSLRCVRSAVVGDHATAHSIRGHAWALLPPGSRGRVKEAVLHGACHEIAAGSAGVSSAAWKVTGPDMVAGGGKCAMWSRGTGLKLVPAKVGLDRAPKKRVCSVQPGSAIMWDVRSIIVVCMLMKCH